MTPEHPTSPNRKAWLDSGTDWIPVLLRVVVALFLVPGGATKFVDYGGQTAFFAELGIPAPGATVLLVGVVELGAAATIATGTAGRVGALAVVPIMVTAIVLAGPVLSNVAVLVGTIGVAVLGTGRYSRWEPLEERLDGVRLWRSGTE